MFNDKDFMGGMFDFDGNGKTTLDEQYVAYKIYEETTKEENDFSSSYHKPAKYSYTNNNSTNSKGTKGGTIIAVVVVIISLFLLFAKCSSSNSNNNSYKSNYRKTYSYSSSPSYSSRSSSTTSTKPTTSNSYSSSSSYSSHSSSGKSNSYSSRNKSSSKAKDEYNAKDYYHAEDFYDGCLYKKCAYQTMGAVLCSLLGIYIYSGGLLMSQTIKQLSQMDGRVYVFFKTEALCQQFLSQAEQEGFTFQDGAKPTERHTSDIIAVNNDFTINYVGSVGHVAFGSNVKRIGEENLIRINYEKFISE